MPEAGALQVMAMTAPQPRGKSKEGQAISGEWLWQQFMTGPSQLWDNRSVTRSRRIPDSRHKRTNEGLWNKSWSNPPWVKAELAATIQGPAHYDYGYHVNVKHGGLGQESNGNCFDGLKGSNSKEIGLEFSLMIAKYARQGYDMEAFKMYKQMRLKGMTPDRVTFICILNVCASLRALEKGKEVHADVIKAGLTSDINLENNLVDMYVKCRSMRDALLVFNNMDRRDVVSWNIMISGYAQHGCGSEAYKTYERMKGERILPNRVTFICVLNACGSLGSLEKGKGVHADILRAGIAAHIKLENSLVNMYAKCNSMKDACQVFDNMAERNVVSWSTVIAGYARHGCGGEALKIYEQMQREGLKPDRVTFISVLNACVSLGSLGKGREVHADIRKAGLAPYINLENTLVDMYAKCGSLQDACQVFDNMARRDVVSWNVMIAGYAQHGCAREALQVYEQMQLEGVMPNKVTFISVLNACTIRGALGKGKEVHGNIIKAGISSYINLENALLDMYAKCGSMKHAHQVFDSMGQQDVVSWSVMITGYALHGCSKEAFEIYEQMQWQGMTPDSVTFICILNACASLGTLEKGKQVHADILKCGIPSFIILENTLLGMYVKCGSMQDARAVFDKIAERDVVSWNTMIAGCAQHGCGSEVPQLFLEMQQEGLQPNGITFISLLCACSHVGLVDEGCHYFESMSRDHGLTPTMEHFGCMVDLLGRAGRLDEAEDFINRLPIEPEPFVWGTLLSACQIHGNVEVGERAAKCLLKWDEHAGK